MRTPSPGGPDDLDPCQADWAPAAAPATKGRPAATPAALTAPNAVPINSLLWAPIRPETAGCGLVAAPLVLGGLLVLYHMASQEGLMEVLRSKGKQRDRSQARVPAAPQPEGRY